MTDIASIKRQIAPHLDACMTLEGVLGCVVVSRTGVLLGKQIDHCLSIPSFAAMAASIHGSAEAATSMMQFSRPSSIFVESDGGGILVMGAGKDALITVIINKSVTDGS